MKELCEFSYLMGKHHTNTDVVLDVQWYATYAESGIY